MAEELKDHRVVTMMTPSELEEIDDWMFKNRIRSRGEAIRRLCQMGIIYDREVRPVVEQITEHIRASVAGEKPKLTQAEHQNLFENMAISLFNAGTVSAKLKAESTDEAIKALTDLYAYYKKMGA
ncbi:hypothetical protein [Devosia sp. 2618]|uniref:hypothetical protein n=1 Tax=Devosia sp. 2618 TaxID=3156454 RepID=UPI003396CA51